MTDLLPLVELASRPEVKGRVAGLEQTISDLSRDELVDAYRRSVAGAPKRPRRNKSFFIDRSRFVYHRTNRIEELLAVGLVADQTVLQVDGDNLRLLDYQVPLQAAKGDEGIGKVDLLGYQANGGQLWVIELKVRPARGRGDTPLRALLEALTYAAILEANWNSLVHEVTRVFDVSATGAAPNILLAATSAYWNGWHTAKASGDWLSALQDLNRSVEERLGSKVRLLNLGNPAPRVVEGWPHVEGKVESHTV